MTPSTLRAAQTVTWGMGSVPCRFLQTIPDCAAATEGRPLTTQASRQGTLI